MNRGTIRQRVRRKLDELNAKFWSDDDLNDGINQSYFFYWQMMIEANCPNILKVTLLNIVATVAEIALPADYIEARLVERVLTNGSTVPMTYNERMDTANYTAAASGDGYRPKYRFVGQNLIVEPTPISSISNGIKLTHIYQPTELGADGDSPDLAFAALFHWLLVYKTVISAKEKEESLDATGVDLSPIRIALTDMEQKFKNSIESPTMQRQQTECYSTGSEGIVIM